jgi:dinuclear metal center YbgI/SA1388 family protein
MSAISIAEVIAHLDSFAHPSLQESYDNSGLLVGDAADPVHGIVVSLDCTEAVVEEAAANGCNLIVAHHPIVFGGIKRLNGANYIERTVITAIRKGIAIYAIHTNLDNVRDGVNRMIAARLGLTNLRVLAPKSGMLRKLVTFAPKANAAEVRSALFAAGAGKIGNYDSCSFNLEGTGTFRAAPGADPFVGKIGQLHEEREERIEVVFEKWKQGGILTALRGSHPYEEVAFDIYSLENQHPGIGSGLIGELPEPVSEADFLQKIKKNMAAGCLRHTSLLGKPVRKVAVCGGSGSFLLNDAKKAGADVFLTADFKYHQFFDADGNIVIADIGHYESEQYTIGLLKDLIVEKFATFAVRSTGVNTNPVHYL